MQSVILIFVAFCTLASFVRLLFSQRELLTFDKEATLPLRGILALLVVCGHLCWPCARGAHGWIFSYGHFEDFSVAAFFFLSGCGMMKRRKMGIGFWLGVCWKLLIPLFVLLLIWQLWLLAEGRYVSKWPILFITQARDPLPHSWYVFVLVLFYLFFDIALRVRKDLIMLLVLSMLVCGYYGFCKYYWHAPLWWWGTCLAFPIGALGAGLKNANL